VGMGVGGTHLHGHEYGQVADGLTDRLGQRCVAVHCLLSPIQRRVDF
jgi:hypothetical protein